MFIRRHVCRGPCALALIGLLAVLVATPVPGEELLPVPRVVAGPDTKSCLGVEAYLTPPKEIADAVLAARSENVHPHRSELKNPAKK